jgi:hypothetical protein
MCHGLPPRSRGGPRRRVGPADGVYGVQTGKLSVVVAVVLFVTCAVQARADRRPCLGAWLCAAGMS